MLILTRKTGQGFTIGGNIEITITEISGDKVRVGIDAPKEIKILRSELTETIDQNVAASTKADSGSLKALAAGLHRKAEKPDEEKAPGQKPDGK